MSKAHVGGPSYSKYALHPDCIRSEPRLEEKVTCYLHHRSRFPVKMRLFGLPAMIALSQLAAFTLAIPVDPASLVARSQLRDDAQTFVAGT